MDRIAERLHESKDFNSRAHVERDDSYEFTDGKFTNFNSRAHVERDMLNTLQGTYEKHFNSRAHVERDVLHIRLNSCA